jgi:glucose-1-phosphate adenylyltransferase
MATMDNILAVILAGGRGARLYPLTKQRSKPAVPFAGKYRLIDIPLSNCINSGIYRVAVLTQYNSVSLHRHINRTYAFDAFHTGWVQIWAAEQSISNTDWYQGSADAVRKQLFEIKSTGAPYVLVLAGDHLYRMDYASMAHFHWATEADITVGVQPIFAKDTGRLGVLKRDEALRITDFAEKTTDHTILASMVSRDDPERPYLGSMGIYMFKISVLLEMLEGTVHDDFGGHVIPAAIRTHAVFGYEFDGYWEDVGTIRTYYDTNLALTLPNPPFDFFDPDRPIYTHSRVLPGSTIQNSVLENVLLSEGCCIQNAEIRHSVVGVRSQVRSGVRLLDTVLVGSDYYDHTPEVDDESPLPPLGLGRDCQVEGAIIDKNARLGRGVVIRPFPRGTDMDRDTWFVRDGIVVIPKDTILPQGTYIGPEG